MIRHVVFFQMKAEALSHTGAENAKALAEKFRHISRLIPGVVECETGFNYNQEKVHYDLCLNQKFENREALEQYLVHPLHLEVKAFVFEVIDHRVVVDYDL